MNLTDAQNDAVNHASGNLQLIACAGSGKTEVVSRRIANLITVHDAAPGNIIAFTFTEKAAAELKDRITRRVREAAGGEVSGLAEMFVGTIHGFCLDLLQTEVPQFLKYNVLNEVQQQLFIDRSSKKAGLTSSAGIDGKPLRRYIDTRHYVNALTLLREAELDEDELAGCSVVDGLARYRDLLHEKNYLDFTGIMEEAVKALNDVPEAIAHIQDRVRHVIVDEYQDLNPLQEQIVDLLRQLGADLCVVGDDDQTIYQWRGSDVRNIITFTERYSPVEQIKIQENFRSSEGILDVAKRIIERNFDRLEKEMIPTGAQEYEPYDICSLHFESPEEEAAFIVQQVQALHGVEWKDGDKTRGLSWSDMAILLRTVKGSADPIVTALREAGIPVLVGGMNNLFESAEVLAARELMYFLATHSPRGRSAPSRDDLKQAWLDADLGLDDTGLEAALDGAEQARLDLESGEGRYGLYSPQREYLRFLESAGLREENVPPTSAGAGRGELVLFNLGKFSQVISDFEQIHFHSDPPAKYQSFAQFLEFGAPNAYPEGAQDSAYANPDAVTVMTVHQSKGMEWPVVFIPQLLRNRFPGKKQGGKSVWHLVPKHGIVDQHRYEGTTEDERRLFYVAITRSQKFLFMSYAPVGNNRLFQRASDFWHDTLASKFVKRRHPDFSGRLRATPEPKRSVSNVVFSFSDLKYFFECPYQFKMRILYGFNAPIPEALGYGKSLHDALAHIHYKVLDGEEVNETEAPAFVTEHLNVPFAYKDLKEKLQASAEKVVQEYIAKNKAEFTNIEFSEKTIELHFSDGVSVVGRIDLVRRLDSDEVTIVDLKSNDRAQPEDVTETQLHTYALGYRELTGRDADFVEIYELDSQTQKARSVDEDFMAEVRTNVMDAAEKLRAGHLPTTPTKKKCGPCDFCNLCSSAET